MITSSGIYNNNKRLPRTLDATSSNMQINSDSDSSANLVKPLHHQNAV